jgi:hypothetical protein
MTTPEPAVLPRLYPDVEPASPPRTSAGEAISLAIAGATLTFGAALGSVTIAGAGLLLVLLAAVLAGARTDRRIRREAKNRFPQAGWAEDLRPGAVWPSWVVWAVLLGGSLALARYLPEQAAVVGAGAWALVAAAALGAVTLVRRDDAEEATPVRDARPARPASRS